MEVPLDSQGKMEALAILEAINRLATEELRLIVSLGRIQRLKRSVRAVEFEMAEAGQGTPLSYFVPLEGEFADGLVTVFTRWPSGYASGPRWYRDRGRLRERIEVLVRPQG